MYYLINKLLMKNKAYLIGSVFLIPGIFISINLGCMAVVGYFISNIASYNDKYMAEYFVICTDDKYNRIFIKEYGCYLTLDIATFCILVVINFILKGEISLFFLGIEFSYSVLSISLLFTMWKIFGNHNYNQIYTCLVLVLLIICFFPEYVKIYYTGYMILINLIITLVLLLLTMLYNKTHDIRR